MAVALDPTECRHPVQSEAEAVVEPGGAAASEPAFNGIGKDRGLRCARLCGERLKPVAERLRQEKLMADLLADSGLAALNNKMPKADSTLLGERETRKASCGSTDCRRPLDLDDTPCLIAHRPHPLARGALPTAPTGTGSGKSLWASEPMTTVGARNQANGRAYLPSAGLAATVGIDYEPWSSPWPC